MFTWPSLTLLPLSLFVHIFAIAADPYHHQPAVMPPWMMGRGNRSKTLVETERYFSTIQHYQHQLTTPPTPTSTLPSHRHCRHYRQKRALSIPLSSFLPILLESGFLVSSTIPLHLLSPNTIAPFLICYVFLCFRTETL